MSKFKVVLTKRPQHEPPQNDTFADRTAYEILTSTASFIHNILEIFKCQ